jgi:hypothetical protein
MFLLCTFIFLLYFSLCVFLTFSFESFVYLHAITAAFFSALATLFFLCASFAATNPDSGSKDDEVSTVVNTAWAIMDNSKSTDTMFYYGIYGAAQITGDNDAVYFKYKDGGSDNNPCQDVADATVSLMSISVISGSVTTGLCVARWLFTQSDFMRNLVYLGASVSMLFGMSSFAAWTDQCFYGGDGSIDSLADANKASTVRFGPGGYLGMMGWIMFLFVVAFNFCADNSVKKSPTAK